MNKEEAINLLDENYYSFVRKRSKILKKYMKLNCKFKVGDEVFDSEGNLLVIKNRFVNPDFDFFICYDCKDVNGKLTRKNESELKSKINNKIITI